MSTSDLNGGDNYQRTGGQQLPMTQKTLKRNGHPGDEHAINTEPEGRLAQPGQTTIPVASAQGLNGANLGNPRPRF